MAKSFKKNFLYGIFLTATKSFSSVAFVFFANQTFAFLATSQFVVLFELLLQNKIKKNISFATVLYLPKIMFKVSGLTHPSLFCTNMHLTGCGQWQIQVIRVTVNRYFHSYERSLALGIRIRLSNIKALPKIFLNFTLVFFLWLP